MKSTLFASLVGMVHATTYTPLLGSVFPKASNLSSSNAFLNMTPNLTITLEDIIIAGKNSTSSSILNSQETSFALQIFAASDGQNRGNSTLFEYFYTSPVTANASTGVRQVDENTVFRIGSASKLWTAYTLLASAGETSLHDPVTKWVPELRAAAVSTARADDAVDFVQWEDVTLLELASHLAGIGRDYAFGDLALVDPELASEGFLTLGRNETPPCGATVACNRAQFFAGITQTHPMAPTSYTPIYSNAGIQILSYALEAITKKTYNDLLKEYLFEPLGLKDSYFDVPENNVGIIPGNASTSLWDLSAGDETPAGGLYASIKDLSTVGRSILSNNLLSAATTRRWLKPLSHTASLSYSVGAPWEIFSFQNINDRTVDMYTKSGDLGAYSSITALLPDYNIGFTILAAGEGTTALVAGLTDIVAQLLIPAAEEAAREEADKIYTGTYAASGLNSSLVISIDNGPGLKVDKWVSKSMDMFQIIEAPSGNTTPDIRLYPTGLQQQTRNRCLYQSFRAVFGFSASSAEASIGPDTGSSVTWELVDLYKYGNVGLDEFLFELDVADGEVLNVSPRALRQTLLKA